MPRDEIEIAPSIFSSFAIYPLFWRADLWPLVHHEGINFCLTNLISHQASDTTNLTSFFGHCKTFQILENSGLDPLTWCGGCNLYRIFVLILQNGNRNGPSCLTAGRQWSRIVIGDLLLSCTFSNDSHVFSRLAVWLRLFIVGLITFMNSCLTDLYSCYCLWKKEEEIAMLI